MDSTPEKNVEDTAQPATSALSKHRRVMRLKRLSEQELRQRLPPDPVTETFLARNPEANEIVEELTRRMKAVSEKSLHHRFNRYMTAREESIQENTLWIILRNTLFALLNHPEQALFTTPFAGAHVRDDNDPSSARAEEGRLTAYAWTAVSRYAYRFLREKPRIRHTLVLSETSIGWDIESALGNLIENSTPSHDVSVQNQIATDQLIETLRMRLPTRQRAIFLLTYCVGLTAPEVGKQLGLRADNVRQILSRDITPEIRKAARELGWLPE